MSGATLEHLSGTAEPESTDDSQLMRGGHLFVVKPPTVDRATAVGVLRDDTEYDFAANAEMNEAELQSAFGEK